MHIAQIGTGRVGRPTAYTIMCSELADELTVCDIHPGLANAFAEELRHVDASNQKDVSVYSCDDPKNIVDVDVILISAGKPRAPGVKMSRRDLAAQNGKIVRQISESTIKNNPEAKYVVITNPVDAMAMVCKKFSGADFVISTGTNLETLRFRSKLANTLKLPVSSVRGYVGGEHGTDAIILWSTVTISDQPLSEYLESFDKTLVKEEIDAYMKSVSKEIVDCIGGTEFGPAASFRDIIRAIVKDTNEVLPIAAPVKFENLSQPIFVSIPRTVGKSIGEASFDLFSSTEKTGINEAAKAIYETFKTTF